MFVYLLVFLVPVRAISLWYYCHCSLHMTFNKVGDTDGPGGLRARLCHSVLGSRFLSGVMTGAGRAGHGRVAAASARR